METLVRLDDGMIHPHKNGMVINLPMDGDWVILFELQIDCSYLSASNKYSPCEIMSQQWRFGDVRGRELVLRGGIFLHLSRLLMSYLLMIIQSL